MLNTNLATLVNSLAPDCREALEQSAAAAVRRQSHEITIEDFFMQLAQKQVVRDILLQFSLAEDEFISSLERFKGGSVLSERPVFSTLLIELLQEAFLLNSLEFRRPEINVFILFLTILKKPSKYSIMPFYKILGQIKADELARLMEGLDEENAVSPASAPLIQGKENRSFVAEYASDFTEEANNGRIDPVFARGPHIRQMIDILSRRRKNNPILVGDPGVGKTAVVEGLALKIAEGNIPEILKGTRIIGLDMGRLQAGASVKGEFEKRLKGVIDEIKSSPIPSILFIDEAHTLVGSGNEAGSADGANLLKPALARGELRTIAATTWSEYKKYFEKDAALARRFQPVRLEQPTAEETITILRGIAPHYEQEHNVYIRDDAVISIAELSTRYISGRQQPDKAIDLLDTACAKVKVSLKAKPASLEQAEEHKASLLREIQALERDASQGIASRLPSDERHAVLQGRLAQTGLAVTAIEERWRAEQALAQRIISQHIADAHKDKHCDGNHANQAAAASAAESVSTGPGGENTDHSTADHKMAGQTHPQTSKPVNPDTAMPHTSQTGQESSVKLESLRQQLRAMQKDDPLVHYEVDPQLVAGIVSDWTGIPAGKINGSEAEKLSSLKEHLFKRIKGQPYALESLEKAILSSRTGLNNPNAPIAIFLLVGPSGVGKTETALAVADEIYGGEEMLISINMSEFQEKHTISRLIGSPPGYVGYGEGGRLTEAVRRQPYSVVLFDEVEKAHPDVINLFYQIFDKGVLEDGEGREVDFKNTLIFLTSNLGADIISALCEDLQADSQDAEAAPDPETLLTAIRPVLSQFFHPALLGRMTIVPYTSISSDIMMELVKLKLSHIAARLAKQHHMSLVWTHEVTRSIAASCTLADTGARNIDHVINATLLPGISRYILTALQDRLPPVLTLGLDTEKGNFTYTGGSHA